MKNVLITFFEHKNKCSHKHALTHCEKGYCPDCGQYLEKNYYLVRCARCDIKRQAKLCWGEIAPKEKFCQNCGATEFYIEKIDKVNFVDVNYALCLKEIADELQVLHPEAQIWVEDEKNIVKRIANKI